MDAALKLVAAAGQTNENVEKFLDRFVKLINDAVVSMYQVMIAVNLLMLLMATICSIWLARHISRPLALVVEAAQSIAGGDLRSHTIIKVIQSQTETVVKIMNQGTVDVDRGRNVIATTGERFQHIVLLVQDLTGQIQEISASAQQIAASGDKVERAVDHVRSMSVHTADNTQTISAAAEEQSAAMEEIASSSQALADMADKLQTEVLKFKL